MQLYELGSEALNNTITDFELSATLLLHGPAEASMSARDDSYHDTACVIKFIVRIEYTCLLRSRRLSLSRCAPIRSGTSDQLVSSDLLSCHGGGSAEEVAEAGEDCFVRHVETVRG